ncbi:hypothetical protein SOVF_166270 [Spinacia oleracea]|nr:kinase-interacting family protein-like isoform X2 [Spinacia oleracea]KNA08039.1 hypothetical protein SOVF_166270 [Spinacia oleracea]
MKRWKTVDESGGLSIQMDLRRPSCCSKPAWLMTTLSDMEQKIRMLVHRSSNENDEGKGDTFGERAECYYQERPQLLSLLLDLYNAYISLAERYCQSLHKHHNYQSHSSSDNTTTVSSEDFQSDAESSLSYQLPSTTAISHDEMISELVIKNVQYDLIVDELLVMEKQVNDSSRKIELQRSLLEVLESERLILLNENAGLRYKVCVLIDENKRLALDSMYVLKMREDHRVCMLSRKIEDLQGKIYSLEKRNRDYYQQLMHKQDNKQEDKEINIPRKGVRISRFWDKLKNSQLLFLCKPHPSRSVVN